MEYGGERISGGDENLVNYVKVIVGNYPDVYRAYSDIVAIFDIKW